MRTIGSIPFGFNSIFLARSSETEAQVDSIWRGMRGVRLLRSLHRAAEYSFPTADVKQMLGEIEAGVPGVIFVDSNIPMYPIGASHPHKAEAQVLLERLIAAASDSSPMPKCCKRFFIGNTAIDEREAIGPAFQVTLGIVDEVIPIGKTEALRSGEIAQNRALMSTQSTSQLWTATVFDQS
jgi:hypothetical protein